VIKTETDSQDGLKQPLGVFETDSQDGLKPPLGVFETLWVSQKRIKEKDNKGIKNRNR